VRETSKQKKIKEKENKTNKTRMKPQGGAM
jgi:hypothetical protein